MIESVRSALLAEFESSMKSERAKFDAQIQKMKDQQQQQIAEILSKGKIRETGEMQVNKMILILDAEVLRRCQLSVRYQRMSEDLFLGI